MIPVSNVEPENTKPAIRRRSGQGNSSNCRESESDQFVTFGVPIPAVERPMSTPKIVEGNQQKTESHADESVPADGKDTNGN